jgi:hypothetical protein
MNRNIRIFLSFITACIMCAMLMMDDPETGTAATSDDMVITIVFIVVFVAMLRFTTLLSNHAKMSNKARNIRRFY